jgi:hypothetical protein
MNHGLKGRRPAWNWHRQKLSGIKITNLCLDWVENKIKESEENKEAE